MRVFLALLIPGGMGLLRLSKVALITSSVNANVADRGVLRHDVKGSIRIKIGLVIGCLMIGSTFLNTLGLDNERSSERGEGREYKYLYSSLRRRTLFYSTRHRVPYRPIDSSPRARIIMSMHSMHLS